MKLNVKKIVKDGKKLMIYAKMPFFERKNMLLKIVNYFEDSDNFVSICADETGRYWILTFILRNKEDILLYRK